MTREIANWFHEREGELFTEEETPFDREELVSLTNDSVDPVQQIELNGDKYIGVISYDEHDGWYEYTRWDDSVGRVNIGVCAACVNEAEMVSEVAFTLDDETDVAREKISQHYDEEHTAIPEDVETGAALLDGTTINTHEAIHIGMDGHNSGVDADTITGNTPTNMVRTGQKYRYTGPSAVMSQFSAPYDGSNGIGLDSNDSIWHAVDDNAENVQSIYKLDQSGGVLTGFRTPSDAPSGLGVDSNNNIWNSDTLVDSIYQFNESGTVLSKFASPSDWPNGIGLDSNDSIWNTDNDNGNGGHSIYKLKKDGGILKKFATPSDSPYGIGLDSNGSIWSTDLTSNSIYQLDQNGSVISQFTSPSNGAYGLGVDSNDSLWNADIFGSSIYQMRQKEFFEFKQP
jgi:sugar lactone lactonase YvrE